MISTHILDTSKGQPAAAVDVSLEKKIDSKWQVIDQQKTNSDGRIVFHDQSTQGCYRLIFKIEDYFLQTIGSSFFADATVQFNIQDTERKYHIPLLVNPFGYSTYRGS